MGRSKEPNTAPARPDQTFAVCLRGDLVHSNTAWPHGSQRRLDALRLSAARKNIRTLPLGEIRILWKQLSPLVHHCHMLPFVRQLPYQIPEQCGFSPPGGTEDQYGTGIIRCKLCRPLKIPGYTDTKGGNLPDPGHQTVSAYCFTAQAYSVPSGGSDISLGNCCGIPGRIPAGIVDALTQIIPGNRSYQPPCPFRCYQLRRRVDPQSDLLEVVLFLLAHLLPQPQRQDRQQFLPCASHLHHSWKILCAADPKQTRGAKNIRQCLHCRMNVTSYSFYR